MSLVMFVLFLSATARVNKPSGRASLSLRRGDVSRIRWDGLRVNFEFARRPDPAGTRSRLRRRSALPGRLQPALADLLDESRRVFDYAWSVWSCHRPEVGNSDVAPHYHTSS
jgi:hypothetical protein